MGSPSMATNSSFLGSNSRAGPSSLCILSTRDARRAACWGCYQSQDDTNGLPVVGELEARRRKVSSARRRDTERAPHQPLRQALECRLRIHQRVRSCASKATRSSSTCKPAQDPFSTRTEARENSSLRARHSVNDDGGCPHVALSRTGSSTTCEGGASSKEGGAL